MFHAVPRKKRQMDGHTETDRQKESQRDVVTDTQRPTDGYTYSKNKEKERFTNRETGRRTENDEGERATEHLSMGLLFKE